jgi:hypothetical protein
MPRKHHTSDEALLQAVIEDLESDSPKRHEAAVRALLAHGPLRCLGVQPDALRHQTATELRDELLAFLRRVVRHSTERPEGVGEVLEVQEGFALTAHPVAGQVVVGIYGTRRTVACLQLVLLLERVGLAHVRLCGVDDCPRLFVKTYRREFCSVRCQKRHYMRTLRAKERERRHKRQQQRRKGVRT